jgi:hypothetical protein
MKAELKRLHSPDVVDLRAFVPLDPERFSLFVQAMVGPAGEDSTESFDFVVCTPAWLRERIESAGPMLGLHHVIVLRYDYDELFRFIRTFCERSEGKTWQEVAAKLGRLGRWEFDEYCE